MMVEIKKLEEDRIDDLMDFLKGKKGPPEGVNRSYLWESTQFNFIHIFYTEADGFENVFYGYGIKDGFVLEEWIRGKHFNETLKELVSMYGGELFVSLSEKKLGEAFGWKFNDLVAEMRIRNLTNFQASAGDAIDYKYTYRAGAIELLSQEWWTSQQATNFVDVTQRNPNGFSKIVVKNGKVLAFGHAMYDEKRAWINSVYVDKENRGKGLGTLLSSSILASLGGKGIDAAYLGVNQSNKAAVALYKKLGFEFTDFRKYEFKVVSEDSGKQPK